MGSHVHAIWPATMIKTYDRSHQSLIFSVSNWLALRRNARHLERRPPVSGRACYAACHPERSEGSRSPDAEILRCAQDDRPSLQMSRHYLFIKEYSHASSADSYPFYSSASPMP